MGSCLSGTSTSNPRYFDPLGPNAENKARTPTGGPEERNSIFGTMNTNRPDMNAATGNFVSGLQRASNDPARAAERGYTSGVLNGDYLDGSPALNDAMSAMRASAGADAANAAARTRSGYAANGMSFGTPEMQAEENAKAATEAGANNAEAQARLQNYQGERQIQSQAPGQMESEIGAPINYLAAVPQAYVAPLSQEAGVVQQLAGGGGVATPTPYQTQGQYGQVMGGIGSL